MAHWILVADEASSDAHAAEIVTHLRQLQPDLEITALGGPALKAVATHFLGMNSFIIFLVIQLFIDSFILIDLFTNLLGEHDFQCSSDTRRQLFKTMAQVQDSVSTACINYFQKFRRKLTDQLFF